MRRLLCFLLLAATTHAAETYVVAAGIDHYDREWAIAPLNYAVADARALAAAFRAAGVPENNLRVLTSEETEPLKRPTATNLIDILNRTARRCDPGDTLVFMFSGHGVQAGDESYLLTVDTDWERLERTALPLRDVKEALTFGAGVHRLLLIDACRNEPRKDKGGGDATLDEGFARGVRGVCTSTSVVVMACDVGQRAWEDPDAGHGAFTAFLLRGMEGEAKDADGTVHVGRLADYVAGAVPEWAAKHGRQQTPRVERAEGLDFVLLRSSARPGRIEEIPLAATLRVTTRPPGATVRLDGQVVGTTPLTLPVPLAAGQARKARVEVGLAGYVSRAANVELVAGATQEWSNVVLDKLPAPPSAPPPEPPPSTPAAGPFQLPDHLAKWSAQMPKGLQSRVRAKDGMPQVLIPAGEFLMGSPDGVGSGDEHPQKKVYVSAFWMDQHEVTVGQYKRFCQAAGKSMASGNADDAHPVVNVDWNDADAYAKWAGGSLPTEAQWEKAARGGLERMAYPWGNDWDSAKASSGGGGTKPVGSYAPNGYGLFDMAGNVWEWCADWYDAGWYATMPARDPVNNTQSNCRVSRGGSWGYVTTILRVAIRSYIPPDIRIDRLGFRCCEAP